MFTCEKYQNVIMFAFVIAIPWWSPTPPTHPTLDLTHSLQFVMFICICITDYKAVLMSHFSLIL